MRTSAGIQAALAACFLAAFLPARPAHAHAGHHHHGQEPVPKTHAEKSAEATKAPELAQAYARIGADYRERIQPIFEKKCFDCHSEKTSWPWYHRFPGIRQRLDADVAEGRKHLDFTNGFPFGGHGSPAEDLEAIEKSVADGTMPPWDYRLMRPGSKLTREEAETITAWARSGRQALAR